MATEPSSGAAATQPLPPGPSGLPVVGNVVSLMRDPVSFFDELAEYGDVVRYQAGRNRFTALLHPAAIEQVLVGEPDRFERWALSEAGVSIIDEGLLSTRGAQWERQRHVMQPAFTVDRITTYTDVMMDEATALTDTWSDGDIVDLSAEFQRVSLRILARTLFDIDLDPSTDEAGLLAITDALEAVTGPGMNLTMLLPEWLNSPAERSLNRAVDRYHDRLDTLITDRRDNEQTRNDLLSTLLTTESPGGDQLTDAEIRDNLLTFLIAGHETTSLALGYTVMCLAEHPSSAAAVRDELAEGPITPSVRELDSPPLLEGAISESMRLYPPAFVMFRRATTDAVIRDYRIPAGTILTLPQFHVHRDDRYFENPDSFIPERWTPAFRESLPDYAFFPFGGGPRHCIGMRFAMLELRTVLSMILPDWEFDLVSNPEPNLRSGITLRPDEPIEVRVSRR